MGDSDGVVGRVSFIVVIIQHALIQECAHGRRAKVLMLFSLPDLFI